MAIDPQDDDAGTGVLAGSLSAPAAPLTPQYPTTTVIVAGYLLASFLAVIAGYAVMLD
ncbi:hypothetical protein [Salipiger mangrovisoli]|uniref:Uncharacterized protein n=1 Tax=Salipiger mangrovisoli TaxID=2865933 RepID=A0ABR9X5F8_9RHOB|nr:hypothetical protein [Salipiger mangrovisoli]MBE9638735.1 hypothetical protein [Salipiger mangrovisoli]